MADLTEPVFRLDAVDPGEAWCGLSMFLLRPRATAPYPGKCMDQSRRGKIVLLSAITVTPASLYDLLETEVRAPIDHLVVERYSLYPWLAREQGYSELLTSQCYGIVKYICDKAGVPHTSQDAKQNLKGGRTAAEKAGFDMVERALGSGRFRYRGPDFRLPGRPHRRDSTSHGVMWATSNPDSPLLHRA